MTTDRGQVEDRTVYKTISVRLNRDIYKRLAMLSTVEEIPIQHLAVEGLKDLLDKYERKQRSAS